MSSYPESTTSGNVGGLMPTKTVKVKAKPKTPPRSEHSMKPKGK